MDDEFTKRIRSACGEWHSVADLSDTELAEKIERDQIDILFDMSSHTSGHRLGVFARKPAPIQISWIGYVGTTGLPAMDHVLGDQYQTPKGSDALYCESVLRLPDGYACYAPPADAPEVNELPALSNGYVTFGCLNNPGKLNLAVFEVFASVLVEVPQSRLLFRFRGMDDPAVNEPIIKTMADLGINAHRMTFEGQAPHSEFLNTYNRIDIALDTFPYSGGLTTCEALWMGTPTITFPGLTFAGRHATSHLHAAGCPEYVANDREKMIEMAVSLANDWDALPEIRTGMRAKIQGSSLCDGHRFAESFAATMRQAWTAWCVQEPDATS